MNQPILGSGTDDEADNYPYHTSSSAIIHLLHGPDGLKPNISLIEDNLRWSYSVPLAAQGTARIASFAIVASRREDAISAVNVLFNQTGFNPQALAFLTAEESDFVNFRFRQPALLLNFQQIAVLEKMLADAAIATILRIGDLSTPLTVQLPVSDNGAATWPNSVTFPVNADSSCPSRLRTIRFSTVPNLYRWSPRRRVIRLFRFRPVLDAEGLRLTPSVESLPENAAAPSCHPDHRTA